MFIESTINSVLSQKGDVDVELIVVDGGSDDETVDILNKYSNNLLYISEPDNGQADAVNKGIAMSSGEIIGWLNSDDIYLDNTIKTVSDYFRTNNITVKTIYELAKTNGTPLSFNLFWGQANEVDKP